MTGKKTSQFFEKNLTEIAYINDKEYLQTQFVKYLNQFVLRVTQVIDSPRFEIDNSGSKIEASFAYTDAVRILAALQKLKHVHILSDISDAIAAREGRVCINITHINETQLFVTEWYTRFRNLNPKGLMVSEQAVLEQIDSLSEFEYQQLASI